MDNFTIAENFSLLSRLMDIHGEDSFRSRSYSIAAFNIEKIPVQLHQIPRAEIASIKGIGSSTGKKIVELLDTGELAALKDLLARTPPGVLEMLNIKGLGPKKIHTIWMEMGIASIGELDQACQENRLATVKGFGQKTQQNIREALSFYLGNQGNFLFAEIEQLFPQVQALMDKMFPGKNFVTGGYRRQDLTLNELAFVVNEENARVKPVFQTAQPPELLEETPDLLLYKLKNGLRLKLHTGTGKLPERIFRTTGPEEFAEAFFQKFQAKNSYGGAGDEEIFNSAGIGYIHPARRWDLSLLKKPSKKPVLPAIEVADIKSIIHSHSNWSDGVNTIQEMAVNLKDRGFEYLVISDHSKAAAYANGLTEERILEQHRYIDQINKELAPFRVFKSIECDILTDGSLDYSDNILSGFDLVIISIHSNLGMSEEKANQRLLKAIEHPSVRILGHMTGRLLLSRNGYPVNHQLIIDACAANDVVIELNANPRRLDMDYRYIDYALEKGVLISINPDAHFIEGFDDIRYGVLAAQKSGLSPRHNLSSFTLTEFEKFLSRKKQ